MSIADPLISDEKLAEIRLRLSNGFGMRHGEIEAVFGEITRLREHNVYLTEMFHGIAAWKVCERHNAVPIVDRVRHDRVVNPSCQDCRAEDLEALAAGNAEATTMASRLRACQERNLSLTIENHRLGERLSARPDEAGELGR